MALAGLLRRFILLEDGSVMLYRLLYYARMKRREVFAVVAFADRMNDIRYVN